MAINTPIPKQIIIKKKKVNINVTLNNIEDLIKLDRLFFIQVESLLQNKSIKIETSKFERKYYQLNAIKNITNKDHLIIEILLF